MRFFFCAWVLVLAVYQFAENTTDPDLFGHIVFGQHMLQTGVVERTEIYSWTAAGQPFMNHEYLVDILLGGIHLGLGGPGILLLKVGIGMSAFLLCLRLGGEGLIWPVRAFSWGIGALAVVEISFGFAPRPQIFTALSLAVELWILRRIHAGERRWAWVLPGLFVFWINAHGGVLAGLGLLFLATAASTAQCVAGLCVARRHRMLAQPPAPLPERENFGVEGGTEPSAKSKLVVTLGLACLGASVALLCNPWGALLPRWLVGSVLWLRPEIEEWNPTPWNGEHAAFFLLLGVALITWTFTRRRRAWWEMAACAAFAVLGLRSVRNTPLCSLVILALAPPHFASAVAPLENHLAQSLVWLRRAGSQTALAALLGFATLGIGGATFILHKKHPLTMEVPRGLYPVSALQFVREHALEGNLLVFFDWGDLCVWQLPRCRPSIDGRLDACYSRELIAEHWKLYRGAEINPEFLNLDRADLALLPANLAGAFALAKRPGWKAVYYDDLAVVLVRDGDRFAGVRGLRLPIKGPSEAALGSEPLPRINPRWQGQR